MTQVLYIHIITRDAYRILFWEFENMIGVYSKYFVLCGGKKKPPPHASNALY